MIERLHSTRTYYRKYIMPVMLVLCFCLGAYFVVRNKFWVLGIALCLLTAASFAIYLKFFTKLRLVYLDETQQELLIVHNHRRIHVPVSAIKRVEKVWISSALLILKFNQDYEFGDEIIFAPKQTYFVWSNQMRKRLQRLMKTKTNAITVT